MLESFRRHLAHVHGARLAGGVATLAGGAWLVLWLAGIAPRWSADGIKVVKPAMAVGQVLAGIALLLLAPSDRTRIRERLGIAAAFVVLLLGAFAFVEHVSDYVRIDPGQGDEPRGVAACSNWMCPPGSLCLLLLGAGLLSLPTRRRALAPWSGLAVGAITLIPAVGLLYEIDTFYRGPVTGMSWSSIVVMLLLGTGLFVARPNEGPARQILRSDVGGALLRRLLPVLILVPLALGFLTVQGQHHGFWDTGTGTGAYTIILVLGFAVIMFRTAASLSRTAAARHASEARFRALFGNMSEAFSLQEIICDSSGRPIDFRFLELNAAFEKQTGLKRTKCLGRTVREVLPSVEPEWIATLGEVALEGTPVVFERHNAATERFYHVYAYRPADRQFACVFTDITQRRRTEEALRRAEQLYRSLFDSIDEGFCVVQMLFDENGRASDARFLEVNPAFARHTGLVQATGKAIREMAPRIEDCWMEVCGKVALSGEAVRFEDRSVALSRWFDLYAFRVGEPAERKVAVIFQDITARKQAEAALRESEERFRNIFEHAPTGIAIMDLHGRFVQCNPAYSRLLGYTEEELHGLDFAVLIHPEDRAENLRQFRRLLDGEVPSFSMENRYAVKGGRTVWAEKFVSVLADASGRTACVVALVTDLTARKRYEQELSRELAERRQTQAALTRANAQLEVHARELDELVEQRTSELREVAQQLETFSYSIAHDLRAPLRTMHNFADLLEQDYAEGLDDTARDYIRRITRSASRMDRLITDVLAYSRVTRGHAQLSATNLEQLVTEIVEGYPQFQEQSDVIRVERPLPPVSANPALLTQVISNLIGNALKFVAAGGPPQVTIRADARGERVRVWVEDRGIGIPVECQDRVFRMFQRLHNASEYPGTGLGLATAKIAVERMGGTIGFESEPGVGTRFWFELHAAHPPVPAHVESPAEGSLIHRATSNH